MQDGDSAVHVAAATGHVDVLQLLVAKGVDINVTTTVCLSVCLSVCMSLSLTACILPKLHCCDLYILRWCDPPICLSVPIIHYSWRYARVAASNAFDRWQHGMPASNFRRRDAYTALAWHFHVWKQYSLVVVVVSETHRTTCIACVFWLADVSTVQGHGAALRRQVRAAVSRSVHRWTSGRTAQRIERRTVSLHAS